MTNSEWFENTRKIPIRQIVELEGKYRTDSLVSAIESAVLEKEDGGADLTVGELIVAAVGAMDREVSNGGFTQFFSNSSRQFTAFLPSALKFIAAVKTRRLVVKAITALGVGKITKETDPAEYVNRVGSAIESESVTDQLDALDSKYYDLDEDIDSLLLLFVKQNLDEFV